MTRVALLRHAVTDWNRARRIQGRRDVPLGAKGRAMAAGWQVPAPFDGWRWVTSPLGRARETAHLLGRSDADVEPRLIEMDWGAWSGRTLDDLRSEQGATMAANEALGLDFRPSGGESPREVCRRLEAWLATVAADGTPTVAVTHRGVQRAALALATGWRLLDRPPLHIARHELLVLALDNGRVTLAEPPLVPMGAP